MENVHQIPEKYILKRWSANAKDRVVTDDNGEQLRENCHTLLTLRYSILCHEAINVATTGASSIDIFEVARQGLRRTMCEVETVKKKQSTNNRKDCPMNEKNVNNQAENIVERLCSWPNFVTCLI